MLMSNKKQLVKNKTTPRKRKPAFATEQEVFWAGGFGDEYTGRNKGPHWIASNLALFAKILARTENVRSLLELGANLGLNLQALRALLPQATLAAVEINRRAVTELERLGGIEVHHASIIGFESPRRYDFVFTKGVLIHINPDKLAQLYDLMHAASTRYICIAEYYSPTPVAIPYRGHSDRLFKRDFARELLERHADLHLIDYGFVYHADPNHPQDDLTWFLLEKRRLAPSKGARGN
jgi:spore coat polysaccharide biosynthesis protein SpsF